MLRFPAAVLLAASLVGCVAPYRMDVQQGNVVSQELVDQLKPGLTKAQVRFVLGTPLITDPFHPDRWDYFYSFRKGRESAPETRRLTLIFHDDTLVRIEGDIAARDRRLADTAPDGGSTRQPAAGPADEPPPPPDPSMSNSCPPGIRLSEPRAGGALLWGRR